MCSKWRVVKSTLSDMTEVCEELDIWEIHAKLCELPKYVEVLNSASAVKLCCSLVKTNGMIGIMKCKSFRRKTQRE